MRGGGGWFGIDEINFGIENKLYVHLRAPCPQLSAPLEFISETRIINSATFSAPTHQTTPLKFNIFLLRETQKWTFRSCHALPHATAPQHTYCPNILRPFGFWSSQSARSTRCPRRWRQKQAEGPGASGAESACCGQVTMSPPTSFGYVVMARGPAWIVESFYGPWRRKKEENHQFGNVLRSPPCSVRHLIHKS